MQRKKLTISLVTFLALGFAANGVLAQHHDQEKKEGKKAEQANTPACPVMGDPVDFSVKTVTAEGPVYFCCRDCLEKFEKNSEKYAAKAAAQRKELKKRPRIQVTCPLSGEPIDKTVFTEHDGRKVYFCCNGCKPTFEKDPAKFSAKLEASYTYQTRCPVMGGKINPSAYVDLPTGQRVFFCCKGCDDKLLKDPAKYAPKLAAQGINIDLEKLKAHKDKGKRGEHEHP
ncbi:MAG: hypothetical protein ACE5I3_07750 [Phycisphaerae bacterium]